MFRILTENRNTGAIKRLLRDLGLDYTVYYCEGSWRGQAEKSMLIELDATTEQRAERVARLIKKSNLQQAVLLQEIPGKTRLI